MNIYKMPLEQFQVNTKFLNTLPDEWSKFVTDVKLVKDLHTTNVDQLHAHLEQHERHANEVRLMHERNSDPLALVASHQITQSPYQTHQHTYQNTQLQPPASTYPSPQYGSPYQSQQYSTHQSSTPLSVTYPSNDFQSSIHHNVYSPSSSIPQLEYPPQINQQSEFSQQDSGLIVPVFQKGDDPIDAINHMMSFLTAVVTSRYPTTNNQLRNSSNPRQQATINNGRVTLQPIQGRQTSFAAGTSRTYTPGASGSNSGKQRTVICYNCKGEGYMSRQCTKPKRKRDDSWFKEKVLLVQAQAHGQILNEELAFLADPEIFLKVKAHRLSLLTMLLIKLMIWMHDSDCDELNSAKVALMENLSHYGSDALAEVHNHDNMNNNVVNQAVQVMPSSQQSNVVNHSETEITSDSNIIPYSQYVIESQKATVQKSNSSAQQEDDLILSVIEQLKTQVANCTKTNLENKSVNDTLTAELKRYKEQVKVLKEGQNGDLRSKDNISDTCAQSVEIDLLKRKQVDTTPIAYAVLKKPTYKDFSTRFVPQTELSAEQAFWSQNFVNSSEPTLSIRPTNVEVPKELPKVSMVNTSLKKLKHHLANFDVDLFSTFNQHLVDELSEVQNVFYQMEQAVEQHRIKSKTFEVKMNQVLNENERLLEQVALLLIAVCAQGFVCSICVFQGPSLLFGRKVAFLLIAFCPKKQLQQHTEQLINNEGEVDQNAEQCHDIRPLPAKLTDNMTTELSDQSLESENVCLKKTVAQFQKDFAKIETHCINLELQMENSILKSGQQSQFLNEKSNEAKVKNDIDVTETINIELEHSVAKLLVENEQLHKEKEHLKQTYKDLFDSIKRTQVQTKDQNDSLMHRRTKNLMKIDVEFSKLVLRWVPTERHSPLALQRYIVQSYKGRTQSLVAEKTDISENRASRNFDLMINIMTFEQRSSSLVLHQMMSDHNSSDLAPQRQEMSVENVSSGLVPQGQKASDYDNSGPCAPKTK
ncbi:hypothetical protein Tco_0658431 [Tanacetum coccineum]